MRDESQPKSVTRWVAGIVLVLVVLLVVSVYVGNSRRDARGEQKRIQAEEERLKDLELTERVDTSVGRPSTLSSAEREELRQLRERAAKRKIERGY